ncbi:diguanylate cyclase (GGDEF)-like protein [Deinococcus sp. HSC-46F16]|uniref:GGDEF domain-containing protein n=1 Tax=Deinococcus sp. HSC-46F16 TaxID=2910968 RepID=UPI00209D0396|nr:GGDEF domain-containing protein [Deinococcus sp. HSC-46F16]MCP2014490.1 diguanylate cyclase (GGDEF)-like protein [Deinococcus sp. HSC-46F16]
MRRPRLRLLPPDPLRLVRWAPLLAASIGLVLLLRCGTASPFYVGLLLAVIAFGLLRLFGPARVRARLHAQFPVAYVLLLLGVWAVGLHVLPQHPATPMALLAALLHTTTLYVFFFLQRSPRVAARQSWVTLGAFLAVLLPRSWMSRDQGGPFDGWTLPLTLLIAHGTLILALRAFSEARAALAEEQARSRLLHDLAHRDPLTGLANRRALEQDLAGHPRRTGALLAVIDVDGLKRVNDSLGHAAGDDLLRRFAGGVARAVGPGGRAYRISGDEFALLIPGPATPDLEDLVETVAGEVRRTYPQAGASVGAAPWQPGESGGTWLARADRAMYRHKERDRSSTQPEDLN